MSLTDPSVLGEGDTAKLEMKLIADKDGNPAPADSPFVAVKTFTKEAKDEEEKKERASSSATGWVSTRDSTSALLSLSPPLLLALFTGMHTPGRLFWFTFHRWEWTEFTSSSLVRQYVDCSWI